MAGRTPDLIRFVITVKSQCVFNQTVVVIYFSKNILENIIVKLTKKCIFSAIFISCKIDPYFLYIEPHNIRKFFVFNRII